MDAARGLLACPVCAAPLDVAARPVRCPAGHSFDVARQGYVNLAGAAPPANADTAPMVDARARVLASGAFDAVDAALARRLRGSRVVLDAGGGTGHHLARLLDAAPDARGVNLDVSVPAARRAARAHARLASVVADTWGTLPLLSRRFDAVLCVFAPRNMAEFARVLGDGGLLVVVTPDPEHLASVRERHGLLGIEPDKDDRLLRAASARFTPVARERVRVPLAASPALVADLIGMGPNAFHGAPTAVDALDTEVAVSVWLFRRAG
ncbi:methyltransferase domain-containing protein [Propioniciclava soli]|uniref:Methyltransferase domain-containing protein n=1 Tax=Propioniciclava soli TaxID=2775081 RepID=A0ABZ3C419_9ACTN